MLSPAKSLLKCVWCCGRKCAMKTVSGNKSFIETLGEREEPRALPPEHYSKVALELPSWCSAYPWGAGALGRGGQECAELLLSVLSLILPYFCQECLFLPYLWLQDPESILIS